MHAHKGVTIQAVVHVLERMGALLGVLGRVSPGTRVALEYPHHKRFHPGSVLDETMAAVAVLHGAEVVGKVMYSAMEHSLEGIVAPLARVFLAMKGGGCAALLERLELLIGAGAMGFQAKWVAEGNNEGRIVVTTDEALPLEADYSWKGTLQYLLAFSKVDGSVTILPREHGGRACVLRVSWTVAPVLAASQ
ncbi:MAG: hypothetical protein JNM17_15985 [Archangium sp.]|nr:hypothetical protein [Archangium sp.]